MINRDELLKMAREAGAFMTGTVHVHEGGTAFGFIQLDAFKDAILERAAVECESQADRFMQGSPLEGNKPYASHECASAIRSLKTQGE